MSPLNFVPPRQRGEALGAGLGGAGGGTLGGLASAHWTQAVKHKGARAALVALGILGGAVPGALAGRAAGQQLPKAPLSSELRWRLANI
jgi:hypothetical protein